MRQIQKKNSLNLGNWDMTLGMQWLVSWNHTPQLEVANHKVLGSETTTLKDDLSHVMLS